MIVVRLIIIILLISRKVMICVCEEERDYPKPSPALMEALMQLKLSDLLRIKHNWQTMSCKCENCDKESSERQENKPIDSEEGGAKALPLTASKRSSDVWLEEQENEDEERPTKLQSIFNASITGLALLSFGGYLLCLVIQAFRSKGATYLYPIVTNQTANSFGASKIKIFRRSKRQATGGGHTSKRSISGYEYQQQPINSDEETVVTDGKEDASDDDSDVQVSVDDHQSDQATDAAEDDNDDDDDDDDDDNNVRWKSLDAFDAIKLFANTLKQMEGEDGS